MKQNLANDAQFNKKIADYYQRAVDQINRTINENAALIVDKDGNHTGYRPVTAGQMASYQREAKHVVEQANQLRANGKTPNYGNWTDEANRRMRVYNATMRINRLELLKSQIGLHLTEANIHIDADLTGKLSDDYIKECQRQAGIMGDSALSKLWTGTKVAKTVMAQTNSATFSQRIWANQDALKAKLDQVIANGVIQGQNPTKMARNLKAMVKDTIKNQRYVTERIARTESARVQFSAQMDSIKANGYEYVQWFAELKACPECAAIERKDSGYGPGVYKISKVPEIPVHPNCRCAISETVLEPDLAGKSLNIDEERVLKRYISSEAYKINDALRQGRHFTPQMHDDIYYLDRALRKMPIYSSDKPLQRDYFFQSDEQKKDFVYQMDNDWFEDNAYISSSKLHYGEGEEQVHVIIKDSKSGRDISKFNPGEQEVLFPRNTKFKVADSYISKEGILTVVWEEM
ncbi:minor capsid protein [uncultured Lentilactobacillus sp.]|uniref:minor capsid protein n=1 Tax=uncultured Lentilactobacillus sp. TaxID=2805375 RepID=UPI00259A54B3|nr:minor capsid protein [uncultured Lentilactobacillus sp.]